MGLREHVVERGFCADSFRDQVISVNDRKAAGFLLDAINEDSRFVKAHVLIKVGALQIERDQIVLLRFDCGEKEVGLFDRIAGLTVVIRTPLVTALLRFDLSLGILLVNAIANRRAMNDADDALVCGELFPTDVVSFKRINNDGDVRVFPGLVEGGRLGESNEGRPDY
jgi:hypothetical protein